MGEDGVGGEGSASTSDDKIIAREDATRSGGVRK